MSDLQMLAEGRLLLLSAAGLKLLKTMKTVMVGYCEILDSYDDGAAGYCGYS